MHAAHINLTETSAAAPPKVSIAGHLSQTPDSFDLAWQQQIGTRAITRATTIGAGSEKAQTGSDTTSLIAAQAALAKAAPKAAATTPAPAKAADAEANVAQQLPTAIPAGNEKSPVDGDDLAALVADTPHQPVQAKPETKSREAAAVGAKITKPQLEATSVEPGDSSLNTVLPEAAASIPASAAMTANAEGSVRVPGEETIKIAATASKRDRSPAATGVSRGPTAKPAQPPGEDASAPDGRQTAPASTLEHGAQTTIDPGVTGSSAGTSAGHSSREGAVVPVTDAHMTPTAAGITLASQPTAASLSPAASPGDQTRTYTPGSPTMPALGGYQILGSGPAQLDVGVFDGTHGWLQIRAELGAGGGVSATVTGSASAHESLREVLPEMASYLQSEALGVSSIAVHRSADIAHATAGSPTGAQTNADAQGQAPRGGQAQDDAGSATRTEQRVDELSESTTAEAPDLFVGSAPDASDIAMTGGMQRPRAFVQPGFFAGSSGWLNVSA